MEPPRLTPTNGPNLCGSCYPGAGDPNVFCGACFASEHRRLEGGQVFSAAALVDDLHTATVPARQHAARPVDLLPDLAAVDPLVVPVLMYGPSGRGKSYQASALFRRGIEFAASRGRAPMRSEFVWTTALGLIEQLKGEFGRKGGGESVADGVIAARMLHLEDIGTTSLIDDRKSDWAYGRLLDIIDQRHAQMRPTIATTNLDLPALERAVGARIVSRLVEDAVVLKVEGAQRRAPRTVGAA